jgi:delta24-sterol reductase
MRHNRSIFWVVADMIPQGNHPLFRALLGWMMPPKIAFLKFSTTPMVRKMTFTLQVFQDIVLPMSAMSPRRRQSGRAVSDVSAADLSLAGL